MSWGDGVYRVIGLCCIKDAGFCIIREDVNVTRLWCSESE